MEKCRAFYPIAGSRMAWVPCVRTAESGSGFCRRHGTAIFGVVLGALVYAEPVDEAVKFPEEPVPIWMRRVEKKSKNCTVKDAGSAEEKDEAEKSQR